MNDQKSPSKEKSLRLLLHSYDTYFQLRHRTPCTPWRCVAGVGALQLLTLGPALSGKAHPLRPFSGVWLGWFCGSCGLMLYGSFLRPSRRWHTNYLNGLTESSNRNTKSHISMPCYIFSSLRLNVGTHMAQHACRSLKSTLAAARRFGYGTSWCWFHY